MKQKMAVRNYNFTDAKLKQLADALLLQIDRDIQDFNDRGFTPAKRSELKSLIEQFENLPSDEQLEGIKMTTTEEKNAVRVKIETALRSIFLMARLVFGENSGKYKEFGNTDLSRQSDEELNRNTAMLVVTSKKYLNDLAAEGLNLAKIDAIDQMKQVFDASIDAQRIAVAERDSGTQNRINMGNALYALMTKYCEIGKDIYYSTNEAKYNDYVIYNTSSGEELPAEEEDTQK